MGRRVWELEQELDRVKLYYRYIYSC
jgi:hypothetical protein